MTPEAAIDTYLEGSPLDRIVFAALIVAGVIVLQRRALSWDQFLRDNPWIWLFFLFGAVAALGSENAFLSIKRLSKATGNVVMAMVILTERQPYVAVGVVLRRLAFLTLPLSLVFIKYFPELGRTYHNGWPLLTGIAQGKNGLGQLSLIAGIGFCWMFAYWSDRRLSTGGLKRIRVGVVFLLLIAWLLALSNSATSLACLCVAAGLLVLSRVPAIARFPPRLMTVVMTSVCLVAVLNLAFDVRGTVISSLDRDPTLTTRVPMWGELLQAAANPIWGAGYEVFWASAQGRAMQQRWLVAQAHNGYLELYLNVGAIGLLLVLGTMASGLLKARRYLSVDYPAGVLRLCFILVVALYNWTEATFSGVSNMWVLFLLGVLEVRRGGALSKEVVTSAIAPVMNGERTRR
jgi:O-antigen ligase